MSKKPKIGGWVGKELEKVQKPPSASEVQKGLTKGAIDAATGGGIQAVDAIAQGTKGIANTAEKQWGKDNVFTKAAYGHAQPVQDVKEGIGQLEVGDFSGAGKSLLHATADGFSPAPILNPGDKNPNQLDKSGTAQQPSSAWQDIPIGPEPATPTFNSRLQENGTIDTALSAASKYDPAAQGTAGKALTDRATLVGNSPWLNLQLKQQALEEQNAAGNAVAGAAGQQAANRASLSTKGGLSSGAAERVARNANSDLTLQKQTIANQGQQTRNALGIADENTKTNLLSPAAGLEQGLSQFNAGQKSNANQFDINNALGQGLEAYRGGRDIYAQQQGVRNAQINANAIAKSGNGGGKKFGT